jgi:CRISPR/Cas system CSM-associated protein Csm3 (group 7 of RAMP superfamily)
MLWLKTLHGFCWDGKWQQLENLGFKAEDTSTDEGADAFSWSMTLDIKIDKGLHLSAGNSGLPEKEQPDLRQAKRTRILRDGRLAKDEYVDYGSSVKGRLRTAMEMILRTYLIEFKGADSKVVCDKIVPVNPTEKSENGNLSSFFGSNEYRGPWGVSNDSCWQNSKVSREDHIRIDEFTQHVMGGAKFDFEPLKKGDSRVKVGINRPDAPEWQKALLLLAGRLLEQDILPWGGHASRGYLGARIRVADCTEEPDKPGITLKDFINSL